MKKITAIVAAALAGPLLLSGTTAFAGGHGHGRHDRHYDHHEWKHHHHHHRHYDRGPAVFYTPGYYAPPPPPVVYRPAPAYYGYPPEPAITIGVGIPPIVIPLR